MGVWEYFIVFFQSLCVDEVKLEWWKDLCWNRWRILYPYIKCGPWGLVLQILTCTQRFQFTYVFELPPVLPERVSLHFTWLILTVCVSSSFTPPSNQRPSHTTFIVCGQVMLCCETNHQGFYMDSYIEMYWDKNSHLMYYSDGIRFPEIQFNCKLIFNISVPTHGYNIYVGYTCAQSSITCLKPLKQYMHILEAGHICVKWACCSLRVIQEIIDTVHKG